MARGTDKGFYNRLAPGCSRQNLFQGSFNRAVEDQLERRAWKKANPYRKLSEVEITTIEQETIARHNRRIV